MTLRQSLGSRNSLNQADQDHGTQPLPGRVPPDQMRSGDSSAQTRLIPPNLSLILRVPASPPSTATLNLSVLGLHVR